MVKNIKSFDQKGGITADTVNINNQYNVSKSQKPKKNWFYIYVGIATILGTAIVVLSYFWKTPKEAKMDKGTDKDNKINITSSNQSGGITAQNVNIGNVNIGSQPRIFNQEAAKNLESFLPTDKNKIITVTAVLGDGEAFRFASQIKQYLEDNRWKVDGVNQAIYSKPVLGQTVRKKSDGSIEIIIGARN